jgi:hypothetical protein
MSWEREVGKKKLGKRKGGAAGAERARKIGVVTGVFKLLYSFWEEGGDEMCVG